MIRPEDVRPLGCWAGLEHVRVHVGGHGPPADPRGDLADLLVRGGCAGGGHDYIRVSRVASSWSPSCFRLARTEGCLVRLFLFLSVFVVVNTIS